MSGEAATVITDRDRADILAGTAGVSNNNKNECIRLRWASFQGRRIVNTGSLLAWLTETLKGGVQTGWGAGLCVQVPWASWRGVAQKKVGNRFNVYASSKTVWKKATCLVSIFFPAQIPLRWGVMRCSAYLVRAEHLSVSAGWCIHKCMTISAIGDWRADGGRLENVNILPNPNWDLI